jgi:hypothetical protein
MRKKRAGKKGVRKLVGRKGAEEEAGRKGVQKLVGRKGRQEEWGVWRSGG